MINKNNPGKIASEILQISGPVNLFCQVIHQKVVDSTNQRLREWNPDEDTLLYADYQTHGRGQGNHTWECPDTMGLLMSLLYHPKTQMNAGYLLKLTAVTVCECLEVLDIPCQIKAPNDILVLGKKVAGILLENTFCGEQLTSSIIGIGINLYQDEFVNGEAYAKPPVSLKQLGITVSRESMIKDFLERFYRNIPLGPSVIEMNYQKKLLLI